MRTVSRKRASRVAHDRTLSAAGPSPTTGSERRTPRSEASTNHSPAIIERRYSPNGGSHAARPSHAGGGRRDRAAESRGAVAGEREPGAADQRRAVGQRPVGQRRG